MIKYTSEEREFLRGYIPGHHHAETAIAFTERFRPITRQQVESFGANNKVLTGFRASEGMPPWNAGKSFQAGGRCAETQFKPGQMPPNWRPVGSVRTDRDGYSMVKVAEPKKWVLKQRLIYEQEHGPIGKSEIVIFLDGNRQNFDLENLACISRRLHSRINQLGLQYHDRESFETACAVAELRLKMGEMKRRRKGERKEEDH